MFCFPCFYDCSVGSLFEPASLIKEKYEKLTLSSTILSCIPSRRNVGSSVARKRTTACAISWARKNVDRNASLITLVTMIAIAKKIVALLVVTGKTKISAIHQMSAYVGLCASWKRNAQMMTKLVLR